MESIGFIADLGRRHATLGLEIQEWFSRAEADRDGLGVHVHQLEEIRRALDALMSQPHFEAGENASDAYIDALEEIVGAGELWRIYQTGIQQHSVSPFRQFVQQATLIAAELVDRVYAVRAPASPPPAPPNPGFVVRRYRAMKLPVPIVLVPIDQSTSFWSLSNLAHEVAHNLDQELGREAGVPLTKDLAAAVFAALDAAKATDAVIARWRRWCAELFADMVGLSLGGAGFASALSASLAPLAGATRFATLDGDGDDATRTHPPPILRQRVLMELLARNDSAEIAAAVEDEWAAVAAPAYLADFAATIPVVADVLWEARVAADGPRVRELAPFAPDARFEPLVTYLAGGGGPPAADRMPRTHVALAAELARRKVPEELRDGVHTRALEFATRIDVPARPGTAVEALRLRSHALRFSRRAR